MPPRLRQRGVCTALFHRRAARGFGLAEALVAMAVLVMIAGLSFGAFGRMMDGRDRAVAITDRYHEARQAMLRMAREISTAYLSVHKDCADPRSATVFTTRAAIGSTRLDITSFSHFKTVADAKESDQNELSYFVQVDADDSHKKNLMRREQNRIDEQPSEGGSQEVLAEDIKSLSFRFYDARADAWQDDWDSTDVDHKNRLPKYVQITLKMQGPSKQELTFVTKTRIFLREAINIPGAGFSPCID